MVRRVLFVILVCSMSAILLFFSSSSTGDLVTGLSRSAKSLYIMAAGSSDLKLPEAVINNISHFVLFVGCDRSGSSILGSLMDAHPHAIVANEWRFPMITEIGSSPNLKRDLFDKLYSASAKSEKRFHSDKGYTLQVDGLWQGTYNNYIELIGDKTSGFDLIPFIKDKGMFRRNYNILKTQLNIPIYAIQAIRNPYDVIATGAIIKARGNENFRDLKQEVRQNKTGGKLNEPWYIEREIRYVFDMYTSAKKVKDIMGKENVLDVHNSDLVSDPRGTISQIFQFMGVGTTEHYLDLSAQKVFKSGSQSRHLVLWTLEQLELVETRMREFEELNKYSFTSS